MSVLATPQEKSCPLLQWAQRWLGRAPSASEETRWRVLQAAAEVFAEAGYHAATTRAICHRAGVNLASIHYHFGDKAELYRAVFRLPFLDQCNTFVAMDMTQVPLAEALRAFYGWLFPVTLEEEPMLQLFLRLHGREEVEPSGVLGDTLINVLRPNHEKLQALLCREFGLRRPDLEVDRLAFCLAGMASVYLHGGRSAVEQLSPRLVSGRRAREGMVDKLVEYGMTLIAAEKKRRAATMKK
ncbi:MAG: DUF1956 domain-containing protein [Sideroxydans sp.]